MVGRIFGNAEELFFKIFASIPISYFCMEKEWWLVIWVLFFVIAIDTVLGVFTALRFRKFEASLMLKKFSTKLFLYIIAMFTFYLLAVVHRDLFGWSFYYIGIVFILGEAMQVSEKLGLNGLKIPAFIMSKFNKDFERLVNSKSGKQEMEVIDEILENKKCQ